MADFDGEDTTSKGEILPVRTSLPKINEPLCIGKGIRGANNNYIIESMISSSPKHDVRGIRVGIAKTEDRQPVAIKEFGPEASESFLRERVASSLVNKAGGHRNVLSAHECITSPTFKWTVLPYIRGSNMDVLRKKTGRFSPKLMGSIVSSLCEALDFIHKQGIIHRDVKPENLLMGSLQIKPQLYLFDFDVSWHESLNNFESKTQVLGSPMYIAPEAWRGHKPDRKTDVYATGVTIYTFLTDRLPFERDSLRELIDAHLTEQIPDPTLFNSDISSKLKTVLERALAKDPDDRYQAAGELKEDYLKAVR